MFFKFKLGFIIRISQFFFFILFFVVENLKLRNIRTKYEKTIYTFTGLRVLWQFNFLIQLFAITTYCKLLIILFKSFFLFEFNCF